MRINKIVLFALSLFLMGISIFPGVSRAEIEIDESDISVSVSPNNPGPNESVTITLSSYVVDLNKALIGWQVSNGGKSSGLGRTTYSFKTGSIGNPININISIKPENSTETVNKMIRMTPSELEVIWESIDGYAPPFYKGKVLPVRGSLIKMVAIPSTQILNNNITSGISYKWKNNGNVIGDASGFDKNYYIFKNDLLDGTNNITVAASSTGSIYNAQNDTTIPVYNPKIIFYKKSPTEGILYNNALVSSTTMPEEEMTIVGEPYFMSLKSDGGSVLYTWQINNKEVETPNLKNELTMRPSSRGGYATIKLTIENIKELFQKVSNNLKIEL